jgi:Ca2+-binding EF-hand superfamily protein
MVTISEFRRWSIDTFHDAEMAWNSLNPAGHDSMNEEEFLAAIAHHGYPQIRGDDAHRRVFNCFKHDEVVTEQGFYDVLDSVSVGRTHPSSISPTISRLSSPKTPKPPGTIVGEIDMDPLEAYAVGAVGNDGQISGGAFENRRGQIIERLRRTDAVVAELIEYLWFTFGSLKMAFQQMDVNESKQLSVTEFTDGLQRVKAKDGSRPIEVHMMNLYKRLDYVGNRTSSLEDLMKNLERDSDPMITRFFKFMNEALEKRSPGRCLTALQDDGTKMALYAQMFKVHAASVQISPEHFCSVLRSSLKYPNFHAGELFRRLDTDDSGVLSLEEFTAFLQKDVPERRERKGPVPPLGNEFRQQQVNAIYGSTVNSVKLARPSSQSTKKGEADLLVRLRMRSDAAGNKFLSTALPMTPDGGFDRPDWVGFVHTGLSGGQKDRFGVPKVTKLSRTGSHVLRVLGDPPRDLCNWEPTMSSFAEHSERCRISSF